MDRSVHDGSPDAQRRRDCANRPHDASDLNQLKCRVETFQLDAGIGGCKAPVSFDVMNIAVAEPGSDLSLEVATVRDAPIETLTGQDSELGLGHIQPASVLGRVVPFE